jgi:hypothetical protein
LPGAQSSWVPGQFTLRLHGSGEQVVGEAVLGAVDEGADLVRLEDERGGVWVGGLAEGDATARELFGFQTVAAVVAPRLRPAVGGDWKAMPATDSEPPLDGIDSWQRRRELDRSAAYALEEAGFIDVATHLGDLRPTVGHVSDPATDVTGYTARCRLKPLPAIRWLSSTSPRPLTARSWRRSILTL